ncbi:MAG: FAD-dependent oxidoreductase [Acidobacteriota bacterium]
MTNNSEQTRSVWMEFVTPDRYRLEGNLTCDVCVVGAGIAGLTTAYLLTRAGLKVFVLDDGFIGGGETARTTAHLTAVLDKRYHELEKLHGQNGAQKAAESHTAAIGQIDRIVQDEQIDCGFERLDGYLFLDSSGAISELDNELVAAHRAGLTGAQCVAQVPLNDGGSFDLGPALKFPDQAQFHPLRYVSGLARAITLGGGKVFTATHAKQITGGKVPRVRATSGYSITAAHVVVATNSPVNDLIAIHTKQAAYRTYVIGVRIPIDSLSRGLYWDTADPCHYLRTLKAGGGNGPGPGDSDLLLVGGEDHKTGQEEDNPVTPYARLEKWIRERFPRAQEIEYRWSGQVLNTVDGLGFIGPVDDTNVFIATGDSGNGMTNGTIAGMILTDLIQGRENSWADIYSPARVTLAAVGDYARENLNAAAQLNEWVTPGTVSSGDEVSPGSGAVMRSGLQKLALYRDEAGVLHEFSAVCPHLGCIVNWNPAERTFDCPCHGSRFDSRGHVINRPANRHLNGATDALNEGETAAKTINA